MTQHTAEYVVVGGGSTGAVVAARLAEAGRDVLLVEAGPDYGPFGDPRWPAELVDAGMLAITHDWNYTGDDGRWTFERARVIGGCSSHNGAIAAVGHRTDYDAWGLPGWSGDDVEPIFHKVLAKMRVRAYDDDEAVPYHRECVAVARDLGWRIASDLCDLDANDAFGLETVNVVDGVRWNTAFAYLDPVRVGGCLRILDETHVDRVEHGVGDTRIYARRQGEPVEITAGTLVLSAGAYGPPAILQRSGIGDLERLRAVGITPTCALPGVGANLHDQPLVLVDRQIGLELQAHLDNAAAEGFLPEEQTLGKAISSQSEDGIFDLHLFPVLASNQTSMIAGKVAIAASCVVPHSRGRLDVVGLDPDAHPVIDHRYLSDAAGHDIAVLKDGIVLANQMLNHPLLKDLLGDPVTDLSTDEGIRANVVHYYHPVGTCAMGDGDLAVCDEQGRVHGLDGIFVADASLIPKIMRANTNMPVIMIGEQIAARLLGV